MKVPAARKLPSGMWFIQLRLGGESIPITARTEKECVRQAEYIKAEYRAGKREAEDKKRGEDKGPTLGEAIDSFIEKREPILSPSTITGYKVIRKNRFQALMGRPVKEIEESEWVAHLNAETKRLSAKTVKNTWCFIQTVMREEVHIEPPKLKLPQVPLNERAFLEPDQIKRFVKSIYGTEVEIPALLALSSLRRSELLALKWEGVDLEKNIITVKGAAVYDSENHLVQKKTNKNRSSTRVVPIVMPELREALMRERKPQGLVVTLHPNTIWRKINECCDAEGLPRIGIHGLRHSFVSLAYHLNVPEKIVMEIGGWADYQTMRKVYTHIAKSDVARSADKLAAFFRDAG